MSDSAVSPYLVPFDGSFRVADAPTSPPKGVGSKKELRKELERIKEELSELQRILYAHDHHAILLVFQAMDAAGKDGTIRHVMSGINPTGCDVHSFKQPTARELEQDFLWRSAIRLPERGKIGVFNRSYYEECLVVRVHPEYLEGQDLPHDLDRSKLWEHRFDSIRDHERHLARNGTMVVKFWLNVSRGEQRQRFLARLNEPEKHWKFSAGDVRERGFWDQYMHAYQEALNATSRSHAPWYAIPADNKPYMRVQVARILRDVLLGLGLRYPEVADAERARFDEMRSILEREAE